MLITEICGSSSTAESRKKFFQSKKLEMLKHIRDSLEQRLSAVDASIDTLQNQINRDINASNLCE